jgi:hypothetical protein
MKKILLFLSFLLMSIGMWGVTYKLTRVTSVSAGNKYVFVQSNRAMFNTITSSAINSTTSYATTNLKGNEDYVWTLESGDGGKFYVKNVKLLSNQYLTNASSGNISLAAKASSTQWRITFTGNVALIDNPGNNNRFLGYNNATDYRYKAYAASNLDNYAHDIAVYVLEEEAAVYTITAQSNNNTYGTVSLVETTITATPAPGYRVSTTTPYTISPSGSATVIQNGNEFTVTPSANTTVTINFERIPKHKITTIVTPSGYGTVKLAVDSIMEDSTAKATATPMTERYIFSNWTISGTYARLSNTTAKTTTITMGTSDVVLTANFTDAPTPTPEHIDRQVFELLTDISDLSDGDSIIILDRDNSYAMGMQNGDYRDVSGTFDIIGGDIEITDKTVQIIRADTIGGTNYSQWRLVVGIDSINGVDTFLCAASSSANQLKSKTTDDANGHWNISIINNIATITAQGSYTRNKMEYNMNNERFSCYGVSDQTPIKIYKKMPCVGNYSILFKNNYLNYDTIEIPSCVKRLHELPINPIDFSMPCGMTSEFVGWSKSEITGDNDKPVGLFKTLQQSPNISSNEVFHAVFAIKNNAVEIPNSDNFIFKTKHWGDSVNSWVNNKDGEGKNTQGVRVTSSMSGAGAITQNTYHKVRSVIVTYSTRTSNGVGEINVKIGEESLVGDKSVTKTGGTEDRYITYTPSDDEPLTGRVSFSVTCSENSIYIKSIQINYTDYEYDFYQTYCTDTLKVGPSWNSGTWSLSRAPYSNERAVILQPVSVDIEHATAKEIVISPSGKLTIEANKGLEVKDTISILNGSHKATAPTDLVLESSVGGNASLIFNNSNGDSATVHLYSKATYPGLDGSNADWQYIGTTMTELNALYNYYGSWLYKWVGGDEKWQAVPNGGMMEAWNGYCITQNEIACHETSGQLVPTTTKTLDIYAPHTVVANSWTAPIHIGAFRDEDFNNISDKRIYLFNTGFDPGGDSAVYETRHNSPGTYVVIPIHAAPYLDKDSLIPSQQGFFVKTNTNGHLILDYDRIVRTGGSCDIVAGPLRAPRRAAADDKPNVLKIYANGSRFSDRLTILEREDFTTNLDNGWDGDKMSFSNLAPSIYVINEDGSYDEVSAIPDYEGTLIGFKAGTDIAYSITFDYDGDETIYLNDMLTQTSTLIDNESKYVFTSDGSEEVRFVISATPYAGVATDIDKLTEQSNTTHKFLYNGNLYILKNNCIFNVVGSLVK